MSAPQAVRHPEAGFSEKESGYAGRVSEASPGYQNQQ